MTADCFTISNFFNLAKVPELLQYLAPVPGISSTREISDSLENKTIQE